MVDRTRKEFYARGIVYQYMINTTTGYWELQERLQAKDKQAQDQFGHSLAIDQDYLVIGAPGEDIKSRTTWDFEMGDLSGWHKSGDVSTISQPWVITQTREIYMDTQS